MTNHSFVPLLFSLPGIAFAFQTDTPSTVMSGALRGVTKGPEGQPVGHAEVTVHNMAESSDLTVVSGSDGIFLLAALTPGRYQLTAKTEGFSTPSATTVDVADQQATSVDLSLNKSVISSDNVSPAARQGFFQRLARAYWDDWHANPESGEAAKYRGYPTPVSNPPYPFSVWPIGGTVWIGYPNATSYPLTTAIYRGEHGGWLKKANVQIYGWVEVGMNLSTSRDGPYANA